MSIKLQLTPIKPFFRVIYIVLLNRLAKGEACGIYPASRSLLSEPFGSLTISLSVLLSILVGAHSFLQSLSRKSGRRSMGGVSFPCFVMNTTNIKSFALKLLFTLLTGFAFMLVEEALVHLGPVKPTEEAYSADDHQNPTNSVRSMDSARSPNLSLVPGPVQVETTRTTLIKNNLPVVEYADFVRRFKVHEDDAVTCVVCMNCIEQSDEIRELRNCSHVFHRECLDTWVNKDRFTCPLCRSTL